MRKFNTSIFKVGPETATGESKATKATEKSGRYLLELILEAAGIEKVLDEATSPSSVESRIKLSFGGPDFRI